MKRTNTCLSAPGDTLTIIFPNLPISSTEVSEICNNPGSSSSHFFCLPSLPQHTISSLVPCSQSGSTTDRVSQTQPRSQRPGKGQKGKSAMGDPQLHITVKGFLLQPEAGEHTAYLDYKNKTLYFPTQRF